MEKTQSGLKYGTKEFRKYHIEKQNLNKPLYRTWLNMKTRCYNVNYRNYHRYGGRGIKVCDEWLNDYKQFELDMGEKPEGYSLDRINNDGNYEKSNVRWASIRTQNLNRSMIINAKGYIKTVSNTFQVQVMIKGKIVRKNFKTEEAARTWYEANRPRIEV